jgi:serine/threonine-protein kinase RsbW
VKVEEIPFINRQAELDSLKEKGQDIAQGRGEDGLFTAPWGSGKTALLKTLKETLFWGRKDLVPVYFSFSRPYVDLLDFVEDYLVVSISQILLYDQKERIAAAGAEPLKVTQLEREAERQGKGIIGEIILDHQSALRSRDERKGLLNALTAPKRIAQATNRPIWVLIDHLQNLEPLKLGEKNIAGLWKEGLNSPWAPHLFSGEPPAYLLKYLLPDLAQPPMSVMELSPLSAGEAEALIRDLVKYYQVRLAGDLGREWFVYLEQNPGLFMAVVREARRQNIGVESHQRFATVYVKALWEGEIGRILENGPLNLREINPRHGAVLLRVLERLNRTESGPLDIEELQQSLSLPGEALYPLIRILERAGLAWERFGAIGLENHRVYLDWVEVLVRKYLYRQDRGQVERSMAERIEGKLSDKAGEGPFPSETGEGGVRFSMVLPAGAESELVAVRALEQIATYTDLEPTSVEKAKLALIEACINAGEHSQSFEKKIRLYFTARLEALEIIVEDRGKAFDPVEVQAQIIRGGDPLAQRRGRGLTLIREMMDEVRFEKAEIGTRLYMIKKKFPKGSAGSNEEF